MHVKKNDNVVVITGKDKGTKGAVLLTIASTNQIVVEGVNVKKRAIRGNARTGKKGELVSVPMPIDASNVRLADGKKAKAEKKEKKSAK